MRRDKPPFALITHFIHYRHLDLKQMAATDVLLSSPMTPGQAVPWSSFEDYIDLPSPLATPRLSNASVSAPSFAVAQQQPALKQAAQDNAPPPGSSPETLFVSIRVTIDTLMPVAYL